MNYTDFPAMPNIARAGDLSQRLARILSNLQVGKAAGVNSDQAITVRNYLIYAANVADKVAGGTGTGVQVVPATSAVVANGASVVVNDNAGTANAKSPAVATVAAGALTKVTLAA